MTVWTNWSWWTYFVVDDDVVTRGCIVSYDLAHRRVTYLKGSANETVESTYHHIWVDPERRPVLDPTDFDLVACRQKPPSFVELSDGDPREYFGGETDVLATYLPDSLLAAIHPKRKPDE